MKKIIMSMLVASMGILYAMEDNHNRDTVMPIEQYVPHAFVHMTLQRCITRSEFLRSYPTLQEVKQRCISIMLRCCDDTEHDH